jgi:hypothetical protein
MRRSRILIAAASAGIAFTSLPAPAAAYWAGSGSGSGSAATTTATTDVAISPGTATHPAFPTGTPTGDVAVILTNPNAAAVRVAALALDASQGSGGFAVDGAHSGCPVASLSYATQTNGGAGWTVPASGSLALDLTGALTLAAAAPDACQGASFTVYLTS